MIGLGASYDFISQFNLQEVFKYEKELYEYAVDKLKSFNDVNIIGNSKISNADEVFIMTDPSSAKDVNQLNDPIARANQKSRLKELRSREKAGKSMTKHSKLKDVKQRVQMEANSKFSKNMKGR